MTPMSRFMVARDARTLPRARVGFAQYADLMGRPDLVAEREAAIEVLPAVTWKGRPLRSVTCSACGQVRNVPETLLWHIVALDAFVCQGCTYRPRTPDAMPLFQGAKP